MLPLNTFDLLVLIILLVGIIYGAIRGASRQVIGLFSAWLGLIICLWLYKPFSRNILMGVFTRGNTAVLDTFAFVMLIIIFAAAIQLIMIQLTKSPEEKRDTSGRTFMDKANEKSTLSMLNVLGGVVTGLVVSLVWLSVFLAPVQFVVTSIQSSGGLIGGLKGMMSTSTLLPVFKQVLNLIYLSIQFFIPPTGLPVIFSTFLGN